MYREHYHYYHYVFYFTKGYVFFRGVFVSFSGKSFNTIDLTTRQEHYNNYKPQCLQAYKRITKTTVLLTETGKLALDSGEC